MTSKRCGLAILVVACFAAGCHKGGESSGSSVTEAQLGLPFYTGSQEMPNASATMEMPDGKSVRSVRTTKDDPVQVCNFYNDKIVNKQGTHSEASGNKAAGLTGKLGDGSDVAISALRNGSNDTIVTVTVSSHKK